MQCYTELLLPSGVTHATSAHFISANSNNLIVAKTSLLQVFSLVNVTYGSAPAGQPDQKGRHDRLQHAKLVLAAEYEVPGTITGLERVRISNSKSGGDAILVSSRNAKLSLIEWDPQKHGITTISIHYYEGEESHMSPWVPDLGSCSSSLTVDPNGNCAIFNFGIHSLAILPFHQAGDDLVMDDYDAIPNGDDTTDAVNDAQKPAPGNAVHDKPYAPSFVLPMTALDPALTHPIHMEFLHEYREPTFGILYSQVARSMSLTIDRKDIVSYSIFTLDLQQKASTSLLTVSRLPSDIFKVVPLPPPIGGALLIGTNELVHVDQAGKTNAVGVNEFARQASAFSMADQSDLEMRLEGCMVEQLGSGAGDVLLILSDGRMAILTFKVDGRSVAGISLHFVAEQSGGSIIKSRPSCSASLGRNKLFYGSEEGDSILLGWSKHSSATKKPSKAAGGGNEDGTANLSDEEEQDDDDDDMYEDDLYSANPTTTQQEKQVVNGDGAANFTLRAHDRLWSLGPYRDITLGRPPKSKSKDRQDSVPEISAPLELVAARGFGKAGGLTVLKREIDPFTIDSLKMDDVYGVWSIRVIDPKSKDAGLSRSYDRYLLLAKAKGDDKEESVVYSVGSSGLDSIDAPEFNPNEDCTIDIGTLATGSRVVQVLRTEIRSYDCNLGLAQIYPVWDEDTSEERTVIQASFAEPYLLTIRDDNSLLILQADKNGDLDEVEIQGSAASAKWVSGCLYEDKTKIFSSDLDTEHAATPNILLFLLDSDGNLSIFRLPNITEPLCRVDNLNLLPSNLPYESSSRRPVNRETLTELLVADLGDAIHKSPYMILRTKHDDLVLYEPYRITGENGRSKLQFIKAVNHVVMGPRTNQPMNKDINRSPSPSKLLRALSDVCGYKTVFMSGQNPCFILKSAIARPNVLRLRGKAVQSLTGFHIAACERGFAYVDEDNVIRMSRLPSNTRFDSAWATRKIPLGEQVDCIVYSSASESYVIGTSTKEDFKLPEDDESHTEWRNEFITFLPQLDRGTVKLLEPKNWSAIDIYEVEPAERITCIKIIRLEISETTHERKDMVVVGSAVAKGEDIVPKGCIRVFEIIDVVPDPDHPEKNKKLKLFAREEVKGAVTAVSGIGGQGFLIVAQGQKCMVRGLKEDGSLLPIAFKDTQCYVNVLKELKGTGMCIIGDAFKGLWFTGYSEEPYKLDLFGKENENLAVVDADFLPDGNKLYILVADDDCNLHVLQYDPEDPSSSKGDRLLHRSVFHTGHFASTMTLLPHGSHTLSSPVDEDAMDTDLPPPPSKYQVLITFQTGSIGVISPLNEDSYRRLLALQSQLVNALEHPCGLNPRGYRAVESDGMGGQRGMIDGNLLLRWLDMGAQRKAEIAGRVGADVGAIRIDLEKLHGGLAYL
ncbi:serine/threonine protein kinase [Nannizzia gypsea CBS 118893]|uniref:Protein CFT1 n=1 Tax=Arthroderma gypseum (strain ATCC MYA-4604 / CBS 118893) TaxID=535722 RepID=E4UXH1_ARTGP|nr:serine/threonine protein kinase [Nannizzia gypsea CBS 118893]EFR01919.1 serine/threonine protein kinase [Nannizzia gypsea CBS 118893]